MKPVFDGTCVPFHILVDYLQAGKTLDKFLKDFPFINREKAMAALDEIDYQGDYEIAEADQDEAAPARPFVRWLVGAFVSPFAVAFVYLLWTDWVGYTYRDVTDYAALALGIGVGVLCLCLLPIPWWVRVFLSVVYISVICYVTWWLYMFALTAQAWH